MKAARFSLWLLLMTFLGVFILTVYVWIEMIIRGAHDGMAEGILTFFLILGGAMTVFCIVSLWVVRNKFRRGGWVMLVLLPPIAIIASFGVPFVIFGEYKLVVSLPLIFVFAVIFYDMFRWLVINPNQLK